uniref:Uncharacterized protein n=1 Tax=Arundo donax TaxID=35708 RepID=A0A0A9AHA7_ARUDO
MAMETNSQYTIHNYNMQLNQGSRYLLCYFHKTKVNKNEV